MKISNLKKGVVGVCAATMLAGMCAVPAFAAASDGVVDKTTGAATSDVTVTNNTQFSATVPTTLAFVMKDDGTVTVPTNAKISNSSVGTAIHVTNMEIKDNTLNLATSASALTGNNAAYMTVNNVSFDVMAASGGYTVTGSDFDIDVATDSSTPKDLPLAFTANFKSLTNASASPVAMTISWTFGLGLNA